MIVDYTGIDEAALVHALYLAMPEAKISVQGSRGPDAQVTIESVRLEIEAKRGADSISIASVFGRPMPVFIDTHAKRFEASMYDRRAGDGTAERVVAELRGASMAKPPLTLPQNRAVIERLAQTTHDDGDHETANACRLLLDTTLGTPAQVHDAQLRVAMVVSRVIAKESAAAAARLTIQVLTECGFDSAVALANLIGAIILLCNVNPNESVNLVNVAIDMLTKGREVIAAKRRTAEAVGEVTP